MGKTVRYTAGLMIAAGAALAFGSPAAAAPTTIPNIPGISIGQSPIGNKVNQNQYFYNATSQTALAGIGNTQYGKNNSIGASTAVNSNSTTQYGSQQGFGYYN